MTNGRTLKLSQVSSFLALLEFSGGRQAGRKAGRSKSCFIACTLAQCGGWVVMPGQGPRAVQPCGSSWWFLLHILVILVWFGKP